MANNYHLVAVKKIVDNAIIPEKGSSLSACFDLYSCFYKNVVKGMNGMHSVELTVNDFGTDNAHIIMYPNDNVLIPTGLIFCMAFHSCMHIYSRSGNAYKKNLIVLNAPGVIDADYTLETFILLKNVGEHPVKVFDKTAVAQGNILPVQYACFSEINENDFSKFKESVNELSERDGGFGSTDNK